jgi:hypothetical protein
LGYAEAGLLALLALAGFPALAGALAVFIAGAGFALALVAAAAGMLSEACRGSAKRQRHGKQDRSNTTSHSFISF